MTSIEIILIIIGVILMLGSFFVVEKLSAKDLDEISKLSTEEMKRILEKNLAIAESRVDTMIDETIEQSIEKVSVALDRESNEKIKSISEYSDTVLEAINKTHNEVMFLYSMLNEKHSDLTEHANQMQNLKSQLEQLEEDVVGTITMANNAVADITDKAITTASHSQSLEEDHFVEPNTDIIQAESNTEVKEEVFDDSNHNRVILDMHEQGLSIIEIAKKLGVGLGEVKLVIDIYRGEDKS